MKHLLFLIVMLSINLYAEESNFYFRSYDQKGFKTTIQEIERGTNYSILEIDVIDSDAQGGPFSIIAAAVEIGNNLQKTHFTLIKEYQKGKLYYCKIFFTSDINEDPSKAFPNEMSQEKLDMHSEIGYLSIATYNSLFNSAKPN